VLEEDKVSVCSDFGESVAASNAKAGRHPWYALQVRSRYEMSAAGHLRSMGYEEFLPLYKCRKRWSDRIKEMQAPLFPGYLFCQFDPQDRLPILKTPGVIQIVGYNRQPIAVDEDEIKSIQTLVTSGIPNQPWPFLKVGEKVRIEAGPLRGLEGVLVGFKGNRRLILSVSLLQRSVAVEIDAAFVRSERTSLAPRLERAYLQPRPLSVAGD
jgi:transcription antitermination factor NusG